MMDSAKKIAALVFLLGLSFCWSQLQAASGGVEPAPLFQGRPAEDWIGLLERGDAEGRRQAVWALDEVGPGGQGQDFFPRLTRLLSSEDRPVRLAALEVLRNLGRRQGAGCGHLPCSDAMQVPESACEAVIPPLSSPDVATRLAALEALAAIVERHGESPCACADEGYPELTRLTRDEDPRISLLAVRTLGHFYPSSRSVRPVLVDAIASDQTAVRDEAAIALSRLPVEPGVTIPALVACLQRDDAGLRKRAVDGLRVVCQRRSVKERLSLDGSGDLQTLMTGVSLALADPELEIRTGGVRLAGDLGPLAGEAVPRLVEILASRKEGDIRSGAMVALMQMGSAAREAVPTIAKVLREETGLRPQAAQALVAIDPYNVKILGPAFVEAFSRWTDGRRPDGLEVVRRAMGEELARFVVLTLSAEMASDQATARETAASVLGRLGARAAGAAPVLVSALADENPRVTLASTRALGEIGASAGEAVPQLKLLLAAATDPELVLAAHEALLRIDPAEANEIGALVVALRTGDAQARAMAAQALGRIGPTASGALQALVEALEDENGQVRSEAARAIGALGRGARPATPALLAGLRSTSPGFRMDVQMALGNIWRHSAESVPGLAEAVRDSSDAVQLSAISVIGSLGPALDWAEPALVWALGDADRQVRCRAALVLARWGKDTGRVLPVLMEILLDSPTPPAGRGNMHRELTTVPVGTNWPLRRVRADHLEPMGHEALAALLSLPPGTAGLAECFLQLSAHSSITVRVAGLDGLGRLGVADGEALDTLMGALTDENVEIRGAAVVALGSLGPHAADAVPGILDLLADDNIHLRVAAVQALGEMGAGAGRAVPALTALLGSDHENLRRQALLALGAIGPAAGPAIGPMTQTALAFLMQIKHPAPFWQARYPDVALALWKLGPEAVPAIPSLLSAARAEETRQAATFALEAVGVQVKGAEALLAAALFEQDPAVRRLAARSLQGLGPTAAPAVPDLIRALNDENELVRSSALDALGAIGPGAGAAVPAVRDIILGAESSVGFKLQAGPVLWQLGPRAASAVPDLLDGLRKDPASQALAVAFQTIQPVSPDVARHLTAALQGTGDAVLQDRLVFALGRLGPRARDAVPALTSLLGEAEQWLRLRIIQTFGLMGSEARDAVSPLAECLRDHDGEIRRGAAIALGQINRPDGQSLAALAQALEDPLPEVRSAALEALYRLGWDPDRDPR